ncbi:hypothetical protein D9757_005840 [Collybiopsis confluens]|uniref:Uncharacterized protein n=1 Tax=Collybiopsis confluens TaxID=2823264 RepID=A0A8H5HNL2_9AGAR|nr:hypothetical protein D9757_005840 [Collybiopsis confluens]
MNDNRHHQSRSPHSEATTRPKTVPLFKLPATMTFEEAASSPIPPFPHMTAGDYRPCISISIQESNAKSLRREIVLTRRGSTATGYHAVQFSVLSGLRVFVTSYAAEAPDPYVVKKIQAAAGEEGISYALDAVSKNGTIEATIVQDHRRKEVGEDSRLHRAWVQFTFGQDLDLPAMPEDKAGTSDHVINYLPSIIEGLGYWKGIQDSALKADAGCA